MHRLSFLSLGMLVLVSCEVTDEITAEQAAECGIELVVEEEYDLGEFEQTELYEYEPPEDAPPTCAQLAEVQAQKARSNSIEGATSSLLMTSLRWETYTHICTASHVQNEDCYNGGCEIVPGGIETAGLVIAQRSAVDAAGAWSQTDSLNNTCQSCWYEEGATCTITLGYIR